MQWWQQRERWMTSYPEYEFLNFRQCKSSAMNCMGHYGKPGLLVDFGCGDSADIAVAKYLGWKAIGIDLWPRGQWKDDGEFILADMTHELPLEEHSIDVALCAAVIPLLSRDERDYFYFNLSRYLKPGGTVSMTWTALANRHHWEKKVEYASITSFGFRWLRKGNTMLFEKP